MKHNNLSIKEMMRLPSIKDIKLDYKITSPISDYIDEELLETINDINNNIKEEKKKTKLIKTHLHYKPYKEVPISYKKWWTQDDVKKLYKGLFQCGYDLSFLERYLNYQWTRDQIKLRLQYEYKVRPKLIEKAMLRQK